MTRRLVQIQGSQQQSKTIQFLYDLMINGNHWELSLEEEDAEALEALMTAEEVDATTTEDEAGSEPTEGFPEEPATPQTDGGTTPPTA